MSEFVENAIIFVLDDSVDFDFGNEEEPEPEPPKKDIKDMSMIELEEALKKEKT